MANQGELPAPRGGVQSVGAERALDLLDLLASAADGLNASDLSGATGLPYATVHRLLKTLARRGYVRQDARTKAYSLGPRMFAATGDSGRLLRRWARPYLDELVALSGETANLAVLDDGQVLYVAQVPSRHQLRMFTEVGNHVLPHATAVGKVLLAFRPRAEAKAVLQRYGLPAMTPRTVTNRDEFLEQLDHVLAAGFAVDDEETEIGVRCLAVPVIGLDGAIAGLSISGPAVRLDADQQAQLVPRMREIAAAFSRSLGGQGGLGKGDR